MDFLGIMVDVNIKGSSPIIATLHPFLEGEDALTAFLIDILFVRLFVILFLTGSTKCESSAVEYFVVGIIVEGFPDAVRANEGLFLFAHNLKIQVRPFVFLTLFSGLP